MRGLPRRASSVRLLRLAALIATACAGPSLVWGDDSGRFVSGYVTLTSDLRRHGLSMSRGEPAVEAGVDVQHPAGFFAGAWLASIEYLPAGASATSTEGELSVYAGYGHRIGRWSMAATLSRYAYPTGAGSYDYAQITGSAAYRDRVFLMVAYTDDLFDRAGNTLDVQLGAVFPLPHAVELGANLGRLDGTRGDFRVTHWNLGLSRTFAPRLGVDLRYYGNSRHFSSSIAESDDRWVISISYLLNPR